MALNTRKTFKLPLTQSITLFQVHEGALRSSQWRVRTCYSNGNTVTTIMQHIYNYLAHQLVPSSR